MSNHLLEFPTHIYTRRAFIKYYGCEFLISEKFAFGVFSVGFVGAKQIGVI